MDLEKERVRISFVANESAWKSVPFDQVGCADSKGLQPPEGVATGGAEPPKEVSGSAKAGDDVSKIDDDQDDEQNQEEKSDYLDELIGTATSPDFWNRHNVPYDLPDSCDA